jgi:hypothetical protein
MGVSTKSPIERFLRQIAPTQLVPELGPCWLWTGAISKGYGRFGITIAFKSYRMLQAHRWAYEYWIGLIPAGLELDHLCRVRACVNPNHLEPVTTRINLLRGRGISARNAAKTHCPEGHSYIPINTFLQRGRKESLGRVCLTCRRERDRRRRAKKRAEVLSWGAASERDAMQWRVAAAEAGIEARVQ